VLDCYRSCFQCKFKIYQEKQILFTVEQGFDVADVDLIVQFGVPKSIIDEDQRGGRGGHYGRECLVLMIVERWAYNDLAHTDLEHKPSKKEERTDAAVIADATSRKDCHRRTLAKYNNDTTAKGKSITGLYTISDILILSQLFLRKVVLR
jgi:Lhr-like helicase